MKPTRRAALKVFNDYVSKNTGSRIVTKQKEQTSYGVLTHPFVVYSPANEQVFLITSDDRIFHRPDGEKFMKMISLDDLKTKVLSSLFLT